jgi:hypothetical protein
MRLQQQCDTFPFHAHTALYNLQTLLQTSGVPSTMWDQELIDHIGGSCQSHLSR